MSPSEMYVRAAELVDECQHNKPSCFALWDIDANFQTDEYLRIFRPENSRMIWGNQFSEDSTERRKCRVLALLLMSEIAKDSK